MNLIQRKKSRSPFATGVASFTAVRMRFPSRLPTLIPTDS